MLMRFVPLRTVLSTLIISCFLAIGYFWWFSYAKPKPFIITKSPSQGTQKEFEDLFHQAQNYDKKNQHDKAISSYKAALKIRPQCAPAHFNLASSYQKAEHYDLAIKHFKKARTIQPSKPYTTLVPLNIGVIYNTQNKVNLAIEEFKTVLRTDKNHTKANAYLCQLYVDNGNYEDALEHARIAAHKDKKYNQAFIQIGQHYRDKTEYKKALEIYQEAYNLDSNNLNTLLNIADIQNLLGKQINDQSYVVQSLNTYKQVIARDPQCYNAYHNSGIINTEFGHTDEAIKFFKHALQLQPDSQKSNMCLGTCYIKKGNFLSGWSGYEHRGSVFEENEYPDLPRITYQDLHNKSLQNKTIVLFSEQGFGDTLQFIRFARLVKECGATVIAQVQKPLKKLLALCPYIDTIITSRNEASQIDKYAQIMSMPAIAQITKDTIPSEPYLYADPILTKQWNSYFPKDTINIGVCWHVDPKHDIAKYAGKKDRKELKVGVPLRSIPLAKLAPLARMKKVQLYSLQKFHGLDELENLPNNFKIHTFDDFDTKNGSFMDTAAIMKNLDLVLTVDTSIAHLAGGLGVKTWLLLPHVAEWRWMTDRDDTPWYPSMKLFRQPTRGNWDSVVQRIKEELEKHT